MTAETTDVAYSVKYEGYRPKTERRHYSVPSGWGTGVPIQDAKMLDAAPELYEAAKDVLSTMERADTVEGMTQALASNGSVQALRSAIAKAEGAEDDN